MLQSEPPKHKCFNASGVAISVARSTSRCLLLLPPCRIFCADSGHHFSLYPQRLRELLEYVSATRIQVRLASLCISPTPSHDCLPQAVVRARIARRMAGAIRRMKAIVVRLLFAAASPLCLFLLLHSLLHSLAALRGVASAGTDWVMLFTYFSLLFLGVSPSDCVRSCSSMCVCVCRRPKGGGVVQRVLSFAGLACGSE